MIKQDPLQPELSDEILAARIAQHDVAALGMIYDRFALQVFTLAAMLSDCVEAELIMLQVFSSLWFEVDQFFLYGGSFQDWLLGLSRGYILTRLEHHAGQTEQDTIDAINRWLSEVASQTTEAGEGFHQPGSGLPVRQALQDLTEEQRCAIILAHYGGYKQSEIARLLSWSLSAVGQHLKEGLQRLRDITKPTLVLERG